MNNKTATIATLWSILERLSTQIIGFVIGIVLARLLSPHDYGVVGLISIFIVISNVFIDSGFGNALIRKEQRTQEDLSTAFYFNVIVGLVGYLILALCSNLIAYFFDEPLLPNLIRIAGINIFINSLCIVHTAILTFNLDIKRQTIINISAQLPAGIIAIVMAFAGFGVYSLVCQTVLASIIKMVLLWIVTKWRPSGKFSKESFKYLWGFGSKLLGASLIGTAFDQIYSVLIGKYIGKEELGYFSKSQHLNQNVTSVGSGIIQKVGLPILARYQKDDVQLQEKFREIMRVLVFVLAGISAFLCFEAKDVIIFLWSEKWINSVVLFQLLVIGSMFSPIGHLSLILMQTKGKTGLILRLELPKKCLYCIYLGIGFMYGVKGLATASIFISITAALVNMWATKKILPYGYLTQLKDMLMYMLVAYPIAYIISKIVLTSHPLLNIIIALILMMILYPICMLLLKDEVVSKYELKFRSKLVKI